jgi:hypothetical protein
MTADRGDGRRLDVSAGEFRALFDAVSTWGRWGERDQSGALHHLDPAHVVAAARLVRDGATVTLSLPLNTQAAVHNPKPAVHHMTMLPDVDIGSGSLRFAMDYVAFDYHSDTYSHIDALCHVAFEGFLYNGHPATAARAGLHPTAMPFVAERRVAALGSDGNSDAAPSMTEGVAFPIHVLAINAMGVRLLDYLQLEDLGQACAAAGRWEFLFMAAPLRILGGTGSPLNPIAVL